MNIQRCIIEIFLEFSIYSNDELGNRTEANTKVPYIKFTSIRVRAACLENNSTCSKRSSFPPHHYIATN